MNTTVYHMSVHLDLVGDLFEHCACPFESGLAVTPAIPADSLLLQCSSR